jgi:hypothetical protein
VIARLDNFQQRHRLIGFPLAVVFKYFDDQGPYLAALIAYYALIGVFRCCSSARRSSASSSRATRSFSAR